MGLAGIRLPYWFPTAAQAAAGEWMPVPASLQKPLAGVTLNPTHPLNLNMAGCWLINEGSGLTLHDLVGSHHGICDASAVWGVWSNQSETHRYWTNNARDTWNSDSFFDLLKPFAIGVRLRYTSAANQVIFERNTNTGFSVQCESGYIQMNYGGTGTTSRTKTASTWNDGRWHTFLIVLNFFGAGGCRIFVDGKNDTNTDQINGAGSYAGATIYLGSRAGAAQYTGDCSFVQIYKGWITDGMGQAITANPWGTPDNPRFLGLPRHWFAPNQTPAATTSVWHPAFNFINEKPPLSAKVNWSHPLNKGLRVWLPLHELGSNAAHDIATGLTYNKQNAATNHWSVGSRGPMFGKADATSYLRTQTGSFIPLNGRPGATLAAWIYNAGETDWRTLAEHYLPGAGSSQYWFGLNGNGELAVYPGSGGGLDPNIVVPANRWVFTTAVITHEAANTRVAFYYDGAFVGSSATGSLSSFYTDEATAYLTLGATIRFAPDYFFGPNSRCSDFQMWDRALSATEARQLYQSYFNSPLSNPRLILAPGLGYFVGGAAPSVTPLTANISDWMSLYWTIVQQG